MVQLVYKVNWDLAKVERRAVASKEFEVKISCTAPPYNQVVLILKKFKATIQVTHNTVNVWCPFYLRPKVIDIVNSLIADDEKLDRPIKFRFTHSDVEVIETPLGAIAALVMYLNENYPGLLDEMQMEALKVIESSCLPKLK